MITETTFWSVVGIIGTMIGALFLLLYNNNAKLSRVAAELEKVVESLNRFLDDRKEKDKSYYDWKERVDEMKTQLNIIVKNVNPLAQHEEKKG